MLHLRARPAFDPRQIATEYTVNTLLALISYQTNVGVDFFGKKSPATQHY